MLKILLGFALVGLPLTSLVGSARGEPNTRAVAGRYVAEIEGQRIELVLRADGTGDLAGTPGTWRLTDDTTIVLSDSEGTALYGQVAGDRLTFSAEGYTLSFQRLGGAAPTGEPSPATPTRAPAPSESSTSTPFRPAKSLPGKTVKPVGTQVSFTVPTGWQHKWGTTDSGDKAYLIIPPKAQNSAAIFVSYRLLTGDEAKLPMATLLRAGANQLLGQATAQIVLGPESFTVGGKTAGRVIFQSQLGAKILEGYLGGIVINDFAYVVLGLYDATMKDRLRAGADTVLASFRGKAPAENLALKRQVVGCWQSYGGSTTSIGSSGRDYLYRFAADGSYAYRYTGSISVEAGSSVSEKHERGTFRVYGDQMTLVSDKGASATYTVRRKGNGVVIGDREYWACQ